ncbi:MAG: phosphoserine phosphatase RsbU/P [Acidobacteriota bacterium]|nr:phosphoserine phosphatase RsbU/P [Acidobacteriota bacterium]
MSRSRILVVDDDPGLRRTLERILAPVYQVETVAGVTEALLRVEAARFDLALVDVRLKDGDGYTLCSALRERRPRMDVILITGSISEPDEKLFRSLEEGAFYFLFKPFDRRVLLALVERCLQLQQERFAKERYAEELAADLEKARLFQQSLSPREPVTSAGWRVDGRVVSCDALGGDFYLAQAVDGGVAMSVSDVVGHGVSAAMYAGMLRSTLDAARRRGIDPERVAREVLLGIDFFEAAACATMVYTLLLPDGRLRYVNAGHPPLLWLKADGSVEHLDATGPLLNRIFRDRPLPVREITLNPGDRVLAYTDGAFEALNPADQELGLERLEEAFVGLRDEPIGEAADALMDLVRVHCAGRPVADDVTVVVVEREG